MALQAGNYKLTANSSKLFIHTYKEGFLSAVARTLLIDATHFTVNFNIPPAGSYSANAQTEIPTTMLKVIRAIKGGLRRNEALKEKTRLKTRVKFFLNCHWVISIPAQGDTTTDC